MKITNADMVKEVKFPSPYLTGDIFNNTSLHYFVKEVLESGTIGKNGTDGYWDFTPELEGQVEVDEELI
jgi:hypothetical protein